LRLAKYLAHAGLASRRRAELLISQRRITVDGETVTDPARNVDDTHDVRFDDRPLKIAGHEREVYALNKPKGVVSTAHDPQGRPTVVALVPSPERLYPVGRLDADTTGLILLTNDGELAHRLAHPSYRVLKTYVAEVTGPVPRDLGRRLRAGVDLDDGPVVVDSFRLLEATPGRALVEVVLHEGRKHVVRRLLAEVGHPVRQLVRTRIGPVRLGELRPGRIRPLNRSELGLLMAEVGL